MKFLLVVFALAVAVSAVPVPEDAKDPNKKVTLEEIENDAPMMHDKQHDHQAAPGAPAPYFGAIPTTRIIPGYGGYPTIGAIPTTRIIPGYGGYPTIGAIPTTKIVPGYGGYPTIGAIPTLRTIPTVGAIPSHHYASHPYAYTYSPYLKTYPAHGPTVAVQGTIPYIY